MRFKKPKQRTTIDERRKSWLSLFLAALFIFSPSKTFAAKADLITPEEYEIYQLVYQYEQRHEKRTLYLDDSSLQGNVLLNPGDYGVTDRAMIYEFNARSRQSYWLNPPATSALNGVLISFKDFNEKRYRIKSAKSDLMCSLSFSRVSFNKNKTKAILRDGKACSGWDGNNTFIVLEKTNNHWQVTRRFEERVVQASIGLRH